MHWAEKTPCYGDIVRTKVSFYYHYGIFKDEDNIIQFGLPDNISQPAESVKVLSTDINAFLRGGELEVAVLSATEQLKRRKPDKTVEYATAKIDTGGYDILHNNCEHFVHECVFGEKSSSFIDDIRSSLRKKLGKD